MKGRFQGPALSTHRQLAVVACFGLLILVGCRSQEPDSVPFEPAVIPPTTTSPAPTHTSTLIPDFPVHLPSPSALPASEERPVAVVCSPLEGVHIEELDEHISNPFNPPPPGSDDPHQGVDLSDTGPGGLAREGLQVNSVLSGRVAGVIHDRFPYGNAIWVETLQEDLSPEWLTHLSPVFPLEASRVSSTLTCPAQPLETVREGEDLSLYILYAHLQSPPGLVLGEQVGCGQLLGAIGSSGNALNPHLHLELRLGPAGARFASMAHYDPSATIDEMAAYCTWRISGIFELLDPWSLFSFH